MKRMKRVRSIAGGCLLGAVALSGACAEKPPEYGREFVLSLPPQRREVWAVAPAINLSGQRDVDPLLQADLLYQQVQQVRGLTVVPVNRVAEVYAGLGVEQVQSAEQAALVCDLLGCDALLVPTVTAFDPYDPPKLGASLHLFAKPGNFARPANVDPRELVRRAAPPRDESMPDPRGAEFVQAVGMFDAANGTTRDALLAYAAGRNDPLGPMGPREYLASMDRYCGFVYAQLAADLLRQARAR
jgi:hypothetical protein